jgi:hypothetical protein
MLSNKKMLHMSSPLQLQCEDVDVATDLTKVALHLYDILES